MDQDLISKKELLEFTGISYGQLYRWKRKNLIPEEWFIRKSTFTGQETFFPKEQILSRIEKIQTMKNDLSLDELADMFSPSLREAFFKKENLISRDISSLPVVDFFIEQVGEVEAFTFDQVVYLYVLDRMLRVGEINLDEAKMVLRLLTEHYPSFEKKADLIFVRKFGMSTCFLVLAGAECHLEKNAKVVDRLSLAQCIEELKIKLM